MKVLCFLLAAVWLVATSVCSDDLSNTSTKVSIDKLEKISEQNYDLKGNSLSVIKEDGKIKTYFVKLLIMKYKVSATEENEKQIRLRNFDRIYNYKLISTDVNDNVVFEWSLWDDSPCGSFNIINNGKGNNYLAWSSSSGFFFEEIKNSNDEYDRLIYFIENNRNNKIIPSLPLRSIIPEVIAWGANTHYSTVNVSSIEKDGKNNWIIKLSPPIHPLDAKFSPQYLYTIVSELNPEKEPAIIEGKIPPVWNKYIWRVAKKEKL